MSLPGLSMADNSNNNYMHLALTESFHVLYNLILKINLGGRYYYYSHLQIHELKFREAK